MSRLRIYTAVLFLTIPCVSQENSPQSGSQTSPPVPLVQSETRTINGQQYALEIGKAVLIEEADLQVINGQLKELKESRTKNAAYELRIQQEKELYERDRVQWDQKIQAMVKEANMQREDLAMSAKEKDLAFEKIKLLSTALDVCKQKKKRSAGCWVKKIFSAGAWPCH